MPTPIQRWKSHIDAVLNKDTPAAVLTRVGNAIASQNAATLGNWATMTNNEKAAACLDHAHKYYVGIVKEAEGRAARQAAITDTATVVGADFTPAP